ncbi:uncharacterized protein TNCV_1807301 [Trichonephila clavipes]|nr:uncharacterized protein TNCV_1807301 [Trichonephila clavipes]
MVIVGVVLDNTTLNCILSHEARSSEAPRVYVVLGLVEVAGMHIAHLLCALCIELPCPDLWPSKHGW